MTNNNRLKTRLSELHVGSFLERDLFDEQGVLLLRRSTRLTQRFVEELERRGIDSVFSDLRIRDRRPALKRSEPSVELKPHLKPYDATASTRAEQHAVVAQGVVEATMTSLLDGDEASLKNAENVADDLVAEAGRDAAPVVASTLNFKNWPVSLSDTAISARGVRIAQISTSILVHAGRSEKESMAAAIASMLSEIALLELPAEHRNPSDEHGWHELEQFRKYPLRSSDILGSIPGTSGFVSVIVGQIHEQADGSGYPRGLRAHRVHFVARVINLVSAYLNLIRPPTGGPGLLPFDAVTYLMHQTRLGRFDRDAMRAFLETVSLYPVGTRVVLDDDTSATVLRAGITPLHPVVILNDSSATVVDLSSSIRSIVRPQRHDSDGFVRLNRRRMDDAPSQIGDRYAELTPA